MRGVGTNASEFSRRIAELLRVREEGRDRVTEMAKQPMGLRRLKQLTKARERSYAIVGDVEEAVRDERNDEMEGVDEDEDEDEFSLIESDTLRRECENLRARLLKSGRRKISARL